MVNFVINKIDSADYNNNNMSIYRAISNGFYWNINKLYDLEYRNLGYYSVLQTELGNFIRGKMIEFMINKNNRKDLNVSDEEIMKIIIGEDTNTEYKIELQVISIILGMNINVYNEYQNFMFGVSEGKYVNKETKEGINLQYFYYSVVGN